MTLPGVDVSDTDGGLGVGLASTGKAVSVVGCCSSGTAHTPTSYVDKTKLIAAFGYGPAVEAACLDIDAGALVVFNKTPGTNVATTGSVTHTGTGLAVMTVSGTPYDTYNMIAKVSREGTARVDPEPAFKISQDGGTTWSGDIRVPANGTYAIPHTGLSVVFSAYSKTVTFANASELISCTAHGFVAGDAVTFINTGGALPTGIVALTTYYVIASGLTADVFRVSATFGGSTINFTTDGTGTTTANKAATMVVDDEYSFDTVEPTWASTDIDDAMAALEASSKEWRFVHVVGESDKTQAVAVDTSMDEMHDAFRYVSALLEVRDMDLGSHETEAAWMADISADFVTFESTRVAVSAGHARIKSAVSSSIYRRPFAWAVAQRACAVEIHVDLGRVKDGSIKCITEDVDGVAIYHDERQSEGLDADRFITSRTFVTKSGYFVTNPNLMAAPGSDFKRWQNRFVMDAACRTTYRTLLDEVNDSCRLVENDDLGFAVIDEVDAQAMEATNDEQLRNDLLAPGHASAARTTVSRVDDVSSTETITATIRIIPLGYKKFINASIAFAKSLAA